MALKPHTVIHPDAARYERCEPMRWPDRSGNERQALSRRLRDQARQVAVARFEAAVESGSLSRAKPLDLLLMYETELSRLGFAPRMESGVSHIMTYSFDADGQVIGWTYERTYR